MLRPIGLTATGLRIVLALVVASGLSLHGLKKRSLSGTGSTAAFVVGLVNMAVSFRFGMLLILFYYSSSYLTKLKQERKQRLEAHYKIGGQRDAVQVFANSLLATLTAAAYWYYVGEDRHIHFQHLLAWGSGESIPASIAGFQSTDKWAELLSCMYIAHFACATGDTWASEVGILSTSRPRLITSLLLREVPHGTNGGLSLLGTLASTAGGLFIGLCYYALSGLESSQIPPIYLATACGFFGSLIDSFLGATLQATYYSEERKCIVEKPDGVDKSIVRVCGRDVLSNDAVNFLSIFLTMMFAAAVVLYK